MRIFAFLLFSVILFAQDVHYTLLLTGKYTDLPFVVRTENSGVYGIASFRPSGEGMLFTGFNSDAVYFSNGASITYKNDKKANEYGAINGTETLQTAEELSGIQKLCYHSATPEFYSNGGRLQNSAGEILELRLQGHSGFVLHRENSGQISEKVIETGRRIAAVDLVGTDRESNVFIIVEYLLNEVPLRIERELHVYDNNGLLAATLSIPLIKGLFLVNEFSVDAAGNFYHLLAEKETYSLLQWSGLTTAKGSSFGYPAKYNYTLHYNNNLPVSEPETPLPESVTATASRVYALRTGESYELFKYYCTTANLSPTAVRAPDGDTVKTPSRLMVGANAKVPYKWGGFSSLAQFTSGLLSGKFAGDIHTSGVSSSSVGVDCSGFVSRCWQLSSHVSTSGMPSITTQYTAWDSLKPGDAVHKVGHVRLFVEKCPNGSLKVVEASARDWGVSYWSYLPSDLSSYTPRYYNNMEKTYSLKKPVLRSAKIKNNSEVMLSWTVDSSNIKGYRVYKTVDGYTWSLIQDETVVKNTGTTIPVINSTGHFRVSSISNDAVPTESNWSNILSVGNTNAGLTVLVIDGFDREIGEWRGAGNPFVYRYAKALELFGVRFESIKHADIKSVNLAAYKAVLWISGDQSTLDSTITPAEQLLLKQYLEQGGSLFISGSEIGWDLFSKGSVADKDFFNNYLKASFVADDAGSESFTGVQSTVFDGINGTYAQTYEVSFPDEIQAFGGSSVAMRYANNKAAGICFNGKFAASVVDGKIIYLAFPIETIANDSTFNRIIKNTLQYFSFPVAVQNSGIVNSGQFELGQNFPNPFNPSTIIQYNLSEKSPVRLEIFDITGRCLYTVVNAVQEAGQYTVEVSSKELHNAVSGVYIYRLQTTTGVQQKKMLLLR